MVGDPLRLRQILVNLLDNAIKFTERGEVVLGLDADRPDAGATRLRITVRDSGIGIPAAQRSRIFQHFTQADSSTTRKHGGTGLGLAICRQLVELMQGRIGVESEEGRGTTCTVDVALQIAPPEIEPPAELHLVLMDCMMPGVDLRGHGRDSKATAGATPHTGRRHDGERHAGRPRPLPPGRHG